MPLNGSETSYLPGLSPQATLTNGRSLTCVRETSAAMSSAISSRASADGLLHSDEPDGPTASQSGPLVAPAPLGRAEGSGTPTALAPRITETSGRSCTHSSEGLSPNASTANRSRARKRNRGSAEQHSILSDANMISADNTVEPRTTDHQRDVNGSIFLPTLAAREGKDWSRAEVLARLDRGDGVAKRICALSPFLRSSQEIVGLNPSFAGALMGFPPEWQTCAPTETRSTHGSRRSLSPKGGSNG